MSEWDDTPHDAAATQALHQREQEAIDALPPRQRKVVMACDVLALPGGQVAAMMGVSPGHQRVLLHPAAGRPGSGGGDHRVRRVVRSASVVTGDG